MSGETGPDSSTFNAEKCSAILVDVAGTTTSIKFVKDELFAYVKEHVEDFLKSQWEDDEVKAAIKKLNADEELDVKKAIDCVKTLTEEQSQNEGLKSLQGLIYKKGYTGGNLKGHVFPDVAECFEAWSKTKKVAVYSTGSVDSSKLLFANSVEGDLSKFIQNYFDQSVGSKEEAESYKNIAKQLEVEPEAIVFITDSVEEAKAAQTGGVVVLVIAREGNPAIPEDVAKDLTIISTFKDINLAKRKSTEESETEAPPAKVAKTNTDESANVEEKRKAVEEKVEETMEVDAGKPSDDKETATKETEPTITKTDEKTETTSTQTASDEKMETVDNKETVKVVEEEEKAKMDEKKSEDVEEKTETKEVIEEKKVEELEVPDKKEEAAKANEENKEDEAKVEEIDIVEPVKKDEEKAVNGAQEEKEEDKAVNGAEEKEVVKNGEKENKSVLANGVEKEKVDEVNGVDETKTDEVVAVETNNEEKIEDESDKKIKKLDDAATAVSVTS